MLVPRSISAQGSTLAVWEIVFLIRSYNGDVSAVAKHLPEEIEEATSENDSADFEMLKRMLPQAVDFVSRKATQG